MTTDPMAQVELDREEHLLRGWPVEATGEPGSKGSLGWLILTNQRCLFFRQTGLLRRQLEKPPAFSVRLERIRSLSSRQFSMSLGYGETVPIPGLEIDGHEFKLNRETPSTPVLAEIEEARRSGSAALRPSPS